MNTPTLTSSKHKFHVVLRTDAGRKTIPIYAAGQHEAGKQAEQLMKEHNASSIIGVRLQPAD